ncbi:hypothetical protein [Mesorhizobium sp.]|uniref:hypothetical protein n=1 Tax=Mesorhizobium sp. TaxID=1871066 RepID=UPI000FE8B3AB|nr:hypothetical protein [Mesorhizobium sp.]RWA58533.1 MAG: hypothetical protein EOQ27_29735 [Mesorhizobium sp.]
MKKQALILATLSLIAFAGSARADDHLVNALQHGLTPDSQPFEPNKAGHGGDLAPGQGSPFVGADTRTPATDTEAANEHANLKDRQPK